MFNRIKEGIESIKYEQHIVKNSRHITKDETNNKYCTNVYIYVHVNMYVYIHM